MFEQVLFLLIQLLGNILTVLYLISPLLALFFNRKLLLLFLLEMIIFIYFFLWFVFHHLHLVKNISVLIWNLYFQFRLVSALIALSFLFNLINLLGLENAYVSALHTLQSLYFLSLFQLFLDSGLALRLLMNVSLLLFFKFFHLLIHTFFLIIIVLFIDLFYYVVVVYTAIVLFKNCVGFL